MSLPMPMVKSSIPAVFVKLKWINRKLSLMMSSGCPSHKQLMIFETINYFKGTATWVLWMSILRLCTHQASLCNFVSREKKFNIYKTSYIRIINMAITGIKLLVHLSGLNSHFCGMTVHHLQTYAF